MNSEIKEMEITDYNILRNIVSALYRTWKMKWIIVFATLIGGLLAVAFVKYKGDKFSYYSTAAIYSAVYGSYSETASGVSLMNTYASVLGTSRVCERAAAEIDDSRVTANYLMNLVASGAVSLGGASSDSKKYGYRIVIQTMLDIPDNVVEITNAMADAYASEINDLLGADNLQVFEKATTTGRIKSVSNYLIVAIFAGVALFLSAVIIFMKEFFSSKVYIVSQCSSDKSMILGLLPYTK
ncbi:MAG: hypothetical protein J5372_06040 [Lachnospiraceae bacterium]|jgi:capsular polysaccharide biosynthesis protein|nr:hypothetical protein [Lachnospiraceae bacterium]MBR4782088.1 hypothetical protein [Lachnospiraceae bacterium]